MYQRQFSLSSSVKHFLLYKVEVLESVPDNQITLSKSYRTLEQTFYKTSTVQKPFLISCCSINIKYNTVNLSTTKKLQKYVNNNLCNNQIKTQYMSVFNIYINLHYF